MSLMYFSTVSFSSCQVLIFCLLLLLLATLDSLLPKPMMRSFSSETDLLLLFAQANLGFSQWLELAYKGLININMPIFVNIFHRYKSLFCQINGRLILIGCDRFVGNGSTVPFFSGKYIFIDPFNAYFDQCLFGVFNSPKKRTKTTRIEAPY